MTQSPPNFHLHTSRFRVLTGVAATLCLALLAGCAGSMPSNFGITPSSPTGVLEFHGQVYGGQQPVSGATIQLYTVGTSALKSSSTALITGTYTTNAQGVFSIPNSAFSCTNATEVYIVSSGGDAGDGPNPNLTLVAALGACSSLSSATSIQLNELTTVAAAYALKPFAQDLTDIGAYGSNPASLLNAFGNAANLVNVSTGTSGGASLPAGATVPSSELNTLADIIASCVNSNGTCSTLFSATGATETFGAALAIAGNPGAAAITALYSLTSPTAPFQPTLGAQPNDFSVAINYNANGTLSTPYGIAIDASGDAWVTNESGTTVTEFSPSGNVLASPAPTGLFGAEGVGVDQNGNVWVANTAGNSAVKFTITTGAISATNVYTDSSFAGPTSVAFDGIGRAYFTNINGNSVTALSISTGAAQSFSPITGNGLGAPTAVARSTAGNLYVSNGNGDAIEFSNSGAYVTSIEDSALQGPIDLAFATGGQLFVTGFTTGTAVAGALSEFNSNTASAASPVSSSGLTDPSGVAADSNSVAWVANSTVTGSLFAFPYGDTAASSPAIGYGSLNTPIGVAVDDSGSVWVTNSGSNSVSVFIGLAAPTITPIG